MATRRFLNSVRLRLGGAIILGFGGLLLISTGLTPALNYLVAQSQPVGITESLLIRPEYTIGGFLMLIVGIGIAR